MPTLAANQAASAKLSQSRTVCRHRVCAQHNLQDPIRLLGLTGARAKNKLTLPVRRFKLAFRASPDHPAIAGRRGDREKPALFSFPPPGGPW